MASTTNGALVKQGNSLPAVSSDLFTQIDQVSATASATFLTAIDQRSLMASFQLADNIEQLRELFSIPEIKTRIQRLQDTPLGFRTDRDPAIINFQTNQPNKPYDYAIVREAVIEALLRGLQLVGNQFNIISGRFYCTKEGFEALIKNQSSVTQFKTSIGIPQSNGDSITIECSATWIQGNEPQSFTAEIPVKVNKGSTSDQLIGKATRRLLSRCYQQMTGSSMPEGDAESPAVVLTQPKQTPMFKASTESTTAHVATLTAEQQQQLLSAAKRVLNDTGFQTFIKDVLSTFEVETFAKIQAANFTAIMQGITNKISVERWNNGCSAKTGEKIMEQSEDVNDAVEEEII